VRIVVLFNPETSKLEFSVADIPVADMLDIVLERELSLSLPFKLSRFGSSKQILRSGL
jgi:hypothetical protein